MLDWERQRKENNDALEASARSFVDHIETIAKCSLEEGTTVLENDDKDALQYTIKILRPAFDQLTKWFIDCIKESSPERAGFGYEKIWELMAAAFLAGRSGTITSSAKNYFTPEIIRDFRKQLTRPATAARRRDAVQTIIESEAQDFWKRNQGKRRKWNDTARAIYPKVKAKLDASTGIQDDWQSVDDSRMIERIRKRLPRP